MAGTKQMMVVSIVVVFLLSCFSFAWAGAMPNMKEGKWQVTTTMDMPGMPMKMPPVVTTQCITKKDMVPSGQAGPAGQKNDCAPADVKVSGNTVSWSIKCQTEGGVMTGTGKVTYSGTAFEGEMKMNQGGMAMTSKMKGKYIGKCE